MPTEEQFFNLKGQLDELERKFKELEEKEKPLTARIEEFVDIPKEGQRMIEDLSIGILRNIVTKIAYGLLTDAQKTDLTDSGETSLHTHAASAPEAHKTSHQDGGADEIDVGGLSGELADNQPPKTHAHGDLYYTEAEIDNMIISVAAGDSLKASADTERNVIGQVSYIKKKEVTVARTGTLRIKFEQKSGHGDYVAYARVYRNGAAVGTEYSTNSITYITRSEDIAGWTQGDLCQLYIHNDVSSPGDTNAYCQNFRIYTDEWSVDLD